VTATDPSDVGRHEDLYLRRFRAAKAAGDAGEMARWWGELLTVRMDWIRTQVKVEARGRLSPTEIDDATQRAAIKIAANMQRTFNGSSIGEWANSCMTLIRGTNIDEQRAAQRHNARLTSMDATTPEGDPGPDAGRAAQREHARKAADELADDERAELVARGNDFLTWALPQLTDKRRTIVELDAIGATTEEMQAALGGSSRDVVYSTRRHAYKHLDELKRTYES
jgi:DNA-directed RNA polymerase specialized sigma24 family protein